MALKRFGVASLRLFGSHSRDEAREDSDVDLLVLFETDARIDQFMDLKFFLQDPLGRPVDLVTQAAVRPEMRDEIERGAICVS